MTATLEKAFAEAARLPEPKQDAFGKFILEELEFLAACQVGADAIERGDVKPIEEVRAMIPQWISESSSRGRR